jgi:hypothetical protein
LVQWFLVAGFAALFGYGVLNVVSPRTTTRWQIKSTARHAPGDPRRAVGEFFQQSLKVDPDGPSAAALRRVRMLGAVEMAVAAVAIAVVLAVT